MKNSEINYWNLDYWKSPEWQAVLNKLEILENRNVDVLPRRSRFAALSDTDPDAVRVVIVGQDPYPSPGYATGHAFSIPKSYSPPEFPPTLKSIFKEYQDDLGYPPPDCGDLARWKDQGVFLWNAIPTLTAGASLSHDWWEYAPLTGEVLRRLAQRGIVFCFLGQVARRFVGEVSPENNHIILTSHPSPRGSLNSKTPFFGSRIFSTINDRLVDNGWSPIDWRLTEE